MKLIVPVPRPIEGLVWREWIEHRKQIAAFLVAWLIFGWITLLFFHPAWILSFGAIYALSAGSRIGGADAAEGSEEFAFALPPTRRERFLVRLAVAGAPLVVLVGGGLLAIGLDLPQKLWGLFVESGFAEPFPGCEGWWYALAAVIPAGMFGWTFLFAAEGRSRESIGQSWIHALLFSSCVAGLGFLVEWLVWRRPTGWISCPVVAASTLAVLALGERRYRGKEGRGFPASRDPRGRLRTLVLLLVILLALVALSVLA
jgi:hypothetical protein